MQRVLQMDSSHRYLRLREIIKDKCNIITREDLDAIMSNINVNRIYSIKSTTSAVKFLNIATAENISTSERKTLSYIIPILGKFEPGYFSNINSTKCSAAGMVDGKSTCAAVKMSITSCGGHITTTYTLAIYIK